MRKEMHKIARHLEHVAALVKHHESTCCRQVLECDDTVKFIGSNGNTRRPAHLYRLCIACAAVFQHLAHTHAEWVFVDASARAVTRYRQNLGASRLGRTNRGKPCAALQRDMAGSGKCFHIIDHGRLVKIAMRHWKRRPVARSAALAFQ